jgi:hypothetical protein
MEQLDQIIEDITSPSAIASLLATSLPKVGVFFMNFIMLQVRSVM